VELLEQPRASSTDLPLSASVISDAEAFEIAQPGTLECDVLNHVALEREIQRQPIAAERIEAFLLRRW
jgi:hypothetical protein